MGADSGGISVTRDWEKMEGFIFDSPDRDEADILALRKVYFRGASFAADVAARLAHSGLSPRNLQESLDRLNSQFRREVEESSEDLNRLIDEESP